MLGLLFEGEAARARGHLGRVLEIGTGCGYQAALLCALSREVVSIERVQALHERARANLSHAGGWRLMLLHADGRHGLPGRAPFDSIVAAAGGDALPEAWTRQLAPGGRLVAPTRQPGASGQVLVVVDKRADGSLEQRVHDGVLFVPLESGTM
jgi:protein-L-isoaspartate(D-aspartate) O-methyltransferase